MNSGEDSLGGSRILRFAHRWKKIGPKPASRKDSVESNMGFRVGARSCQTQIDDKEVDVAKGGRGSMGLGGKRQAVGVENWGVVDGQCSRVVTAVNVEESKLARVDEDDAALTPNR